MKLKFIYSLLAFILFTGCVPTSEETSNGDSDNDDSSSYSIDNNDNDDDNDDKDDDDNDGTTTSTTYTISSHNQGASCLSCHAAPARSADGEDFLSGATVYTALDATSVNQSANGYIIRALLSNGQAFNYSSGRGTGNSNNSDSRLLSYSFTAQVINSSATVVNASVTNSHNSDRLDCNSCHTSTGNNGAPGRITSFNPSTVETTTGTTTGTTTETTTGTFEASILPILDKCKVCHTTGTGRIFSVTTATATYDNIIGFNGIDTVIPDNSLLLTKASARVSHGGGIALLTTDADYISIRDWIAAGATLGTVTQTTPVVTPIVTTAISFSNDVLPVLNGCKGCHGTDGRFTVTTASATYSNIASFNGVDTVTPANSLLLTKASGVSHGGGTQLSTTSTGYATLRDWIAQGAANN
ncbi:hypothetical protein KKG72_00595 [bacterium]|nr:hypothetical protein [bacterium]